jgi:hypothetical protein
MSDNLERFIRKNRKELDDAAPPAQLWEKVKDAVPVKKDEKRFTLRDIYKWSAAAAIAVILLSSLYFLVIRKNSHEGSTPAVATVNPTKAGNIAPEYAAEFTEVYRAIGQRQKELKASASGQPELYQQFQNDLAALDSSYQLLRNQAEHSPNKDVLVKAMIQNLKLQAELLSRQLMISDQLNNSKKSTNETRI